MVGTSASRGERLRLVVARARSLPPAEWGDLVRQASPHRGPWPRVSIWHGTRDRVVTLESGGVLESVPETPDGREAIVELIEGATLLWRAATLQDVAYVAAFVASDRARTMTAATANVSC